MTRPAGREVPLLEDRAERQDAIIAVQLEGAERSRVGHRSMMRIVEQEREAAAGSAAPAERRNQLWTAPLVHQHEPGALQRCVQIGQHARVGLGCELGIGAPPFFQGLRAVITREIRPAPAVDRLKRARLMPFRLQRTDDPAQEVRVAVVPVGDEGVREENEAHGIFSLPRRPAR